ncbi:MAG: hypothetical protein IPM56_10705 [Ignavibacteriales bacterium]|nr:MAG: hypothetical protein IPM56_10705 [Ignavibacteriales bacterium]
MDWYAIKFYDFEIQKEMDSDFIISFNRMYDNAGRLDGLTLHRDNHSEKIYKYYYLSIPESFPVEPKKLFENYRIARTFPPDLMMLEQVAGKLNNTEDSY